MRRYNYSFQSGIVFRQKLNSLKKEFFRKTIHLCSSLVPLFLRFAFWPIIILLILAAVLYSICEYQRLQGKTIPIISKITEIAARKRDENKFVLGPVTLVLGILFAALLLPLKSATVGIYALAFGDGLASLVGKIFGKTKIPFTQGKTIAGSSACFMAVFVSTLCVSKNLVISLIIAFSAMVIEVLPLKDYDNLIIPIAIGSIYRFLLWGLF